MRIDLTKSVSPFSRAVKMRRALWNVAWALVFWMPRWGNTPRIWVLRAFGAKVEEGCLIERGVRIWMPWNLTLRGYVALGRGVEIYNYAMVDIGRMTVVSQYTYLCTGSHDHTHPHMPLIWKPITIGSECWVAAGVFVSPGVVIGDGAVVAAKSVVTRDVPPWTVAGGNPARPLKTRELKTPNV
jgi:putative colanic acid biosynthesis acetyltransferase WcaF